MYWAYKEVGIMSSKNLLIISLTISLVLSGSGCYKDFDTSRERVLSPTDKLLKKGISDEDQEEFKRRQSIERYKAERLKWQK
jgi:hypothetical protein